MKLQIKQINELIDSSLKLAKLYVDQIDNSGKHIKIPASLKGIMGELIVYKKLLQEFPDRKKDIEYQGGTNPYDISICGNNVEVKTKWFDFEGKEKIKAKYGGALFEGCPTVKKKTIVKCHFIIFVVLYINKAYSRIYNKNIYIFYRAIKDFKSFKHEGVLASNKDRYTIWKIIKKPNRKLTISPGNLQIVNFYKTKKYKTLFRKSENAWSKIRACINS